MTNYTPKVSHKKDHQFSVTLIKTIDNWSYYAHSHDDYSEFVITTSGQFTHTINGKEYIQKEREIILIRDFDIHKLDGNNFSFVNFTFNSAWFARLEYFSGLSGLQKALFSQKEILSFKISKKEWPNFLNVINDFVKNHNKKTLLDFADFFTSTVRKHLYPIIVKPNDYSDVPSWLNSAIKKFKEKNLTASPTVKELISYCNLSPEHVSRSFKKHINKSPSAFVQDERLMKAARLLSNTNYTITDVYLESGFNNPSYFHRSFKEKYGMTPRQYRLENSVVFSM